MKETNIFESKKVGKLLLKFAIPCVISMLVNSIYNIVDQIFIGHIEGVGYLCNAATNVVFPMVVIGTALSLLIGDGAASFLSLNLGEKDFKEAKKGIGNAIMFTLLIAFFLFLVFGCNLSFFLDLFGSTEIVKSYAMDYGRIIVLGLPFMIISTSLNSIIRADGSPRYAMVSMLVGAIFNLIFDPICIFALHMGIKGAALATIVGQLISALISLLYLRKFRSISLERQDFLLSKKIFKVLSYGVSSLITQLTIVAVIIFNNNLLVKYGALSKYGADIPLSVFGIVMKITQIFTSIIVGIAVGSQPIVGYNYGAKRFDLVKETFKKVILINMSIGVIAVLCFQLFPDKLIAIFGSGNALYNEFAVLCFRTFLILTCLNSFQISAGIFFQSLGKPIKASICSISRQIVFLIPAGLCLGSLFGIHGVLWSGPVADGLAFLLSLLLFIYELKHLKENRVAKDL